MIKIDFCNWFGCCVFVFSLVLLFDILMSLLKNGILIIWFCCRYFGRKCSNRGNGRRRNS